MNHNHGTPVISALQFLVVASLIDKIPAWVCELWDGSVVQTEHANLALVFRASELYSIVNSKESVRKVPNNETGKCWALSVSCCRHRDCASDCIERLALLWPPLPVRWGAGYASPSLLLHFPRKLLLPMQLLVLSLSFPLSVLPHSLLLPLQEYIRRQLEEEQRQLEILQQQLLHEQALLLVMGKSHTSRPAWCSPWVRACSCACVSVCVSAYVCLCVSSS